MIFIYILFIAPIISNTFSSIFYNPLFQIILFFIIIFLIKKDKTLGIFFMILISLTLTYCYYTLMNENIFETFKVVKDDINLDIKKKKNLLIHKLINNIKNINPIWSDTILGKNLGLNK